MAIYELGKDKLTRLEQTQFSAEGVRERQDLQRVIRDDVKVLGADLMVIAEEFEEWEDSRRRVDLLCLDKQANLVVVELKRHQDDTFMDLQAIRYAAMVSGMTFEKAVDVHTRYLRARGKETDGQAVILEHLGWEEPDEANFAQEVRIILAAEDFSKELTTAVLWLNERNLKIQCISIRPYRFEDRILVDVQQKIPLPETEAYQVRLREKGQHARDARSSGADFTRYDVQIENDTLPNQWKRNAIYAVCRRLVDHGVSPEKITSVLDVNPIRLWRIAEGTLDSDSFEKLAYEDATNGGPGFNRRRWFLDESRLIHFGGKTYAFTDQWGGDRWKEAMDRLCAAFPKMNIRFTPSSQ